MFVVLDATPRGEMVRTDYAVVRKHNAARCHAEVCSVIGHRAANTSHQTACGEPRSTGDQYKDAALASPRRYSPFTLGDGRAVGAGDEAGEADVDGAAEASVHRCSRGVVCDALSVVKLPTHRNHAAAHIFAALFTHKAGVDP